jgi:ATP-dependent Clp protease, protease subunit
MYISNENDFKKYYTQHLGGNSMDLHNFEINNQTPAILDRNPLNGNLMSVFDRLMADRIIFVNGGVNDYMCNIINAQLMYLDTCADANGETDIQMYINSPGGSVYAGLSTVDAVNMCESNVLTSLKGMGASMGSIFIGMGLKGERSMTRFSKVMLHQSSGGFSGNIQDAKISMDEWNSLNETLLELLAGYCDRTVDEVREKSSRDFWLNAKQALEFGIVDKVFYDNKTIYTKDDLGKF